MQLNQSLTVSFGRLNGSMIINSTDLFNRMNNDEIIRVSFNGTPSNFPTAKEIERIKSILLTMREKYNDGILEDKYIIEFKDIGVFMNLQPFPGYLRPGFNILTEWLQFIKK